MFRSFDQLAVFKCFPTPRAGFLYGMVAQETSQSSRYAVVEKNMHVFRELAVDRGLFERTSYKGHECVHLLMGYGKLFDHFLNAHASFEIFKQDFYWRSCVSQHPCATHFAGDAFYGGALGPVDCYHDSGYRQELGSGSSSPSRKTFANSTFGTSTLASALRSQRLAR